MVKAGTEEQRVADRGNKAVHCNILGYVALWLSYDVEGRYPEVHANAHCRYCCSYEASEELKAL
jgi:hypothetical protein